MKRPGRRQDRVAYYHQVRRHRDWLTGNGDAEGVIPMKALTMWQPWAYVYNLELAKRAAPYRSGKSDKKFMFAASSHRRASSR